MTTQEIDELIQNLNSFPVLNPDNDIIIDSAIAALREAHKDSLRLEWACNRDLEHGHIFPERGCSLEEIRQAIDAAMKEDAE